MFAYPENQHLNSWLSAGFESKSLPPMRSLLTTCTVRQNHSGILIVLNTAFLPSPLFADSVALVAEVENSENCQVNKWVLRISHKISYVNLPWERHEFTSVSSVLMQDTVTKISSHWHVKIFVRQVKT